MSFGVHQISEGHVGIYWRGGALLKEIAYPGYHVKIPFITSVSEVQITVQSDSVNSIPCGTSGGVMIHFDKIEVVNRLRAEYVHDTIKNYTIHYDQTWIFDKIHHEINQFCSKHSLTEVYITLFDTLDEHLAKSLQQDCDRWAPGIEIISVRVTKPRIPEPIRRNFEQMEAEKTKLLIAEQAQKVIEKEAETERKRRTIEAQTEADISRIHSEKQVQEKEAQQRIALIQDQIHLQNAKAQTDAEFYSQTKVAEANSLLLTPQFLQYQNILSLANNLKVYFGEKIPSVLLELTDSSSLKSPQEGLQKKELFEGIAKKAMTTAPPSKDSVTPPPITSTTSVDVQADGRYADTFDA